MKINSVYIASFGGIKNKTVDFSKGFNVIYGENEKGKSTLMAFIKMMFYGSDRGSGVLKKNIRKKYTPWDNSQMAGIIDFTLKGKNYRLEREFRASNSTDKVTLIDLDFGDRKTVSADIGNELLGLSAAAFERSVFIGQLGFPESDDAAAGELNSKLSNITSTGDESVSFEEVNTRLDKAKFALMSKSGRAGEYDKNLKVLSDIKAQIEASAAAQLQFDAKKEAGKVLENQIADLQKRADEIKVKISAEQDARNAEKLKEFLELKAKLDLLANEIKLSDGSLADEMYIRKLQFCSSKVTNFEEKLENKCGEADRVKHNIELILNPPENASPESEETLEKQVADLENQIENKKAELIKAEEKIADTANENRPKKPFWPYILLVSGILLDAAAGVLGITKYYYIAALGAALLVAFMISLVAAKAKIKAKEKANSEAVITAKQEQSALKEQIDALSKTLFEKKVSLQAIKTALNANKNALAEQQALLEALKAECDSIALDLQKEKAVLKDLMAKYKTDLISLEAIISELSEKNAALKEIKANLQFISKDLGGIDYTEAAEKLTFIESKKIDLTADFDLLKGEYDSIVNQIGNSKAELATIAVEAKGLAQKIADTEALKKTAHGLAEALMRQKEFCDTVNIAQEVLLESFAELRRSYGSVLEKKAGEIFALLTSEKYSSMSISKSLDINVTKADVFGEKEVAYLSSGTADQAYLSLRLALSSLLCEKGEALPILLDDALTQYDDTRLNLALAFLSDYAKEHQIALFTCHSDIGKKAEALGAQIINL